MRAQRWLACVIVAGLVANAQKCPDEAGSTFKEVRAFTAELQRAGRGAEAVTCHQRCAELDPRSPDPWHSIGEIYRQPPRHMLTARAFDQREGPLALASRPQPGSHLQRAISQAGRARRAG